MNARNMMRRTADATSSCPNVALLLLVLCTCCPLESGRCNNTDCDYAESYDKVVTVNVTEPVHITKYKWCLDIPPRCPDNKLEYRTVRKNITIPKTRTVRRCCKDQIQLYDNCVPRCTEDQCPNVQCAPGTDKCKCKPGYTGHLCRQKCDVGRWGPGCRAACDRACSDCDHRTGCCKTPADVDDHPGLTLCAASTAARQTSDAARQTSDAARQTSDASRDDGEADGSPARRFGGAQSSQTAEDATWEPASAVVMAAGSGEAKVGNAPAAVETPAKRRDDDNGGEFLRTVTKMEVTVYKYDELVKKLVWISSMTIIAIAMVFVIMFVVFFNCYGVSKVPAGRRTSAAVPTASDKIHETCIGTQNIGYVPPDRYTRSPALRTLPTNTDLPVHPEIFCPVFSAPHYPGSTLYDSPQPLYEILC